MSLDDWLKKHTASPNEIADLLAIVERDLADCQARGLTPDWRLNIAFNAALQAATAALAAEGYRASGEGHHFRTIQSLAHTIKLDTELVEQLDAFRKKRIVSVHDRAGAVSDAEAKEMYELAEKLQKDVKKWLAAVHPELTKE